MSEDAGETNGQLTPSESARLRSYRIRMMFVGFGVLVLSLISGLAMSFYQWDRGSPFDTSTWHGRLNPIGRATYGPLAFTLMLFPITIPALFVLALPIYFGLKKQRLWPLALVGYLAVGVLWVFWLDGLWQMD